MLRHVKSRICLPYLVAILIQRGLELPAPRQCFFRSVAICARSGILSPPAAQVSLSRALDAFRSTATSLPTERAARTACTYLMEVDVTYYRAAQAPPNATSRLYHSVICIVRPANSWQRMSLARTETAQGSKSPTLQHVMLNVGQPTTILF